MQGSYAPLSLRLSGPSLLARSNPCMLIQICNLFTFNSWHTHSDLQLICVQILACSFRFATYSRSNPGTLIQIFNLFALKSWHAHSDFQLIHVQTCQNLNGNRL